jgi:large conductance mechanosensitive channel
MFKGFREFVLRGSVVDLAVGVVMGAAFGAVVTGFVKDLLTPLIAAIAGKPDFSAYNGSKFLVGDFLNVFISFVLISLAVYFFVVIPVNHLMTRFNLNAPATKKTCPECQSEIPVAARKCAFCTSAVV